MVEKYKMKDVIKRIDWKNRQLIVLHEESLYFIPFQDNYGIKLALNSLPSKIQQLIVKALMLKNTKHYKFNNVKNKSLRKYPFLYEILNIVSNITNDPSFLDEFIEIIDYNKDKIDIGLKNKIKVIVSNTFGK